MKNNTGQGKASDLVLAYQCYWKDLNLHAYFKLGDRMLSEDMVQDTFVRTWVYISKGGNVITLKAFLYRVLNNLIIDHYRKKKALSLDQLLEAGFDPSGECSLQNLDFIDGKNAAEFIPLLPERYRIPLTMRYMKELTLREISAIIHQPMNTVSVQIHRGLEKLRALAYPEAASSKRLAH